MIASYGSALVILVASGSLGLAITSVTRSAGSLSPAVGLAALIGLCSALVRLPGATTTAAVGVALACAAAALVAIRARPTARGALVPLAAGALSGGLGAIPFLAHERVGLLGMSLNNDTAVHLLWAEGLRSERMAELYTLSEGYPIGPHTLMATLATGLGVPMDSALVGLAIAVPVVIAITALGFLRAVPAVAAVAVAAIASFAYLTAAYYGQGAFKELLQSLFLLAFVLGARDLGRRPAAEWGAAAVPLGLLLAGCISVYSFLGVAWFVGFLGTWGVLLLLVHRPGRERLTGVARRLVRPLVVGGAVLVAGILPQVDRVLAYLQQIAGATGGIGIAADDLGNLVGPLSPFQALGIWRTPDFRFAPAGGVGLEHYAALGLVLVATALWLRRRDTALPAAVLSSAAIYAASSAGQSPYAVAKALAIPAPLVVILVGGALLGAWRAVRLPLAVVAAGWAAAYAFLVLALISSTLALRYAPVAPSAQSDQLAGLRSVLRGGDTLFLGRDDYAGWRLRGVRIGQVAASGFPPPVPVAPRPEKPYEYGQALDFDSVEPQDLDRFRYVVIPRSSYRSAPPPNFTRVRATPLFEVWERRGPTPPSESLEPGGAPGAVLDCRAAPDARRLSRRPGTALVVDPPPVVGGPLGALAPGASQPVALELGAGEWSLSLQYQSPVPLRIQTAGQRWRLPANLGRPGPFFAFGRLRVPRGAPATGFTVIAERVSRLASSYDIASVSALAATSRDGRRVISLERACGAYVDRYRPAR